MWVRQIVEMMSLFFLQERSRRVEESKKAASEVVSIKQPKSWIWFALYLTIRLQAQVFYEQIVNEAQPSWLSLVENEGE